MFLNSLLAVAIALTPLSQGDDDWTIQQQLLRMHENSDQGARSLEEAYEGWEQLRSQPLDINRVTADDLLNIPGVDVNLSNAILEYRYKYGRLRSIDELQMIETLDPDMVQYLQKVLMVDNSDTLAWYSPHRFRDIIKHPEHKILLAASIPTYYRAGDRGATSQTSISLNKYAGAYLGDPLKHSLRYSLSLGQNLQFNLTGAKTAGEPFFAHGNNAGYDRYAYNLSARNIGVFRQIILGKYRAQFGMGLVLNNNFTIGKQAMLAATSRLTNSFSPHSSTSDSKHFQGIAATIDYKDFSIAFFASYREIDATLNDDGSISTILSSTYHRTANEMRKKNNATQQAAGAHLKYVKQTKQGLDWGMGLSMLYTHLGTPINPVFSKADTISQSKLYRAFYPKGTDFVNASVDYRLSYGSFHFMGETAVNRETALATLNNIVWNASRTLTLSLTQRYYSHKYHSLYGSAVSDGDAVQNEQSLMFALKWQPKKTLVVNFYSDFAHHPWLKYRVSAPSYSTDHFVDGTLRRGSWSFSTRYRLRTSQQDGYADASKKEKTLITHTTHRLRFITAYTSSLFNARVNLEGVSNEEGSRGFILSPSATYSPSKRWSVHTAIAYFNTDDYDSRLYHYERGMTYSFSNASYYGHGIRYALLGHCAIAPWLTAKLKAGITKYFDRNTIGTAERQIFSSHQTDIDFQLLIKL